MLPADIVLSSNQNEVVHRKKNSNVIFTLSNFTKIYPLALNLVFLLTVGKVPKIIDPKKTIKSHFQTFKHLHNLTILDVLRDVNK